MLTLTFEDGSNVNFTGQHNQDCCESVYADFGVFEHIGSRLEGHKLRALTIKGVEDMGFLMCFDIDFRGGEKVFVACYNYQNGYYSSDLALVVAEGGGSTSIDISKLIDHHID